MNRDQLANAVDRVRRNPQLASHTQLWSWALGAGFRRKDLPESKDELIKFLIVELGTPLEADGNGGHLGAPVMPATVGLGTAGQASPGMSHGFPSGHVFAQPAPALQQVATGGQAPVVVPTLQASQRGPVSVHVPTLAPPMQAAAPRPFPTAPAAPAAPSGPVPIPTLHATAPGSAAKAPKSAAELAKTALQAAIRAAEEKLQEALRIPDDEPTREEQIVKAKRQLERLGNLGAGDDDEHEEETEGNADAPGEKKTAGGTKKKATAKKKGD